MVAQCHEEGLESHLRSYVKVCKINGPSHVNLWLSNFPSKNSFFFKSSYFGMKLNTSAFSSIPIASALDLNERKSKERQPFIHFLNFVFQHISYNGFCK